MRKIKVGIYNIGNIYLQVNGDIIRINDISNDGVIECEICKLRETIRIIEQAYRKQKNRDSVPYGYGKKAINLQFYQTNIGKRVFRSNYIMIIHIPDIIKMLKSVKFEKEKYILNKDSMLGLCIKDLARLNQSMRRRKRVLTDNNGNKYIEV